MIYDVIFSLLVLREKLAFFNKQLRIIVVHYSCFRFTKQAAKR